MNDESMSDDVRTAFIRLNAYVGALEELLISVVDSLPNRAQVVANANREGSRFDALALHETFSDEQLDAFQEARQRLLSIVSAKS